MFPSLPKTALEFKDWTWSQIEPYFKELETLPVSATNLSAWLDGWSHLSKLIDESYWRHYVANTIDTTDLEAERRYTNFLDEIRPRAKAGEQEIRGKLLSSGLTPPGFEVPLRNLHAQAELYREANLPLLSDEKKLASEYDKIIGAQTILWDGREVTIPQLQPVYQEINRERRENAWRMAADRQLADRQAINQLWARFMETRRQLAANADLPDYRAYRWREQLRFDYTPEDCFHFHEAIESVVVPAARAIYEKRRQRLGLKTVRPWDLMVNPFGRPPLKPFQTVDELVSKTAAIFQQVDPQLGQYFEIMRWEGLLDLDNRKGKAPGGYCTGYLAAGRPFIFINAVGVHDDVQTLLHEGGHAFHVFEGNQLNFHQQEVPLEFCEVASMGMEFLASPYLPAQRGGFYSNEDAAHARLEHLETSLLFWPYMAVVDAFQHWIYENHEAACDPVNCDAKWAELWDRFMTGEDWSGLEQEKITGWQRKLHIHEEPFYYIEYGLAQLGAVQIWRNALQDQASAVNSYRKALAMGGRATLPQLFATAGANFAFDASTLRQAVDLMMRTITSLEVS